jgi:guanylate kinase
MTPYNSGGTVIDLAPGEGALFVLVGPAGVGKNTVISRVMEQTPRLRRLPTATTRPSRIDEQEGREHFFMTLETFQKLVAENGLIEHQEVHPGKFYGAVRQYTHEALDAGALLIADIDILGAEALKADLGERAITIFIFPPSLEVLEERLRKRGNMPEEEIADRLKRASFELSRSGACQYRVTNDTLEQCVNEVTAIIRQEIARRVTT